MTGVSAGRARLDLAHGAAVDVVAGGAQRPEARGVAGQLPQLRAAGQHGGQPAAGRRRQRVLGVGRQRQPADDGRRRCRAGAARRPVRRAEDSASGSCSRCRRCSSDERDAEADRYGDRQPGDPAAAPPAGGPALSSTVSVPISSDRADAGHGEPPADLPERPAQHRLARPFGQRGPHRQARAGWPPGRRPGSARAAGVRRPLPRRPDRLPPARRPRPAARPGSPTVSR